MPMLLYSLVRILAMRVGFILTGLYVYPFTTLNSLVYKRFTDLKEYNPFNFRRQSSTPLPVAKPY